MRPFRGDFQRAVLLRTLTWISSEWTWKKLALILQRLILGLDFWVAHFVWSYVVEAWPNELNFFIPTVLRCKCSRTAVVVSTQQCGGNKSWHKFRLSFSSTKKEVKVVVRYGDKPVPFRSIVQNIQTQWVMHESLKIIVFLQHHWPRLLLFFASFPKSNFHE